MRGKCLIKEDDYYQSGICMVGKRSVPEVRGGKNVSAAVWSEHPTYMKETITSQGYLTDSGTRMNGHEEHDPQGGQKS